MDPGVYRKAIDVPIGEQARPRVEMRGISKSFLGLRANDKVSIRVNPGEICALLGENGAGKSTLMNILFGLYAPDEGQIFVDGRERRFLSPGHAIAAGVGMIHQHFTLVPGLSVIHNLMIGPKGRAGFWQDMAGAESKARRIMQDYGIEINLKAIVGDLAVGQRQKVEILKALYRGAEILIMDEPTAVLAPQESEALFTTLRQLTAKGSSVILISHKMREIMAASDRVYVLRRGQVVAERRTLESSGEELATLMVGRSIEFPEPAPSCGGGQAVLEVRGLQARKDSGAKALNGLSLCVGPGQILGLAGVSGNGQTELCEIIFGLRLPESGSVEILGRELDMGKPREALSRGVARIPEDRIGTGLLMDLSVEENLFLPHHRSKRFRHPWGLLDRKAIGDFADALISEFSVKADGRGISARSLSGGNLQKIILARELQNDPRLVIASQPTRGLDLGAIEFIHKRLLAEREKGAAILLVSDDLDEVLQLSDRVAVVSEGRIIGEQLRSDFNRERIGLWMSGVES